MVTFAASDPTVDAQWMRRAIELARRGEGFVEPNPMVGCVIVRDGKSLAEGWHRRFGAAHAERDALAMAGPAADLTDATWYVTLEPCCHTGKTPPCSQAVVAARPRRVVVGIRDPHPFVNGGGLREIADAGIEISVGIEAEAIRELCAPFLHRVETGLPWVIAKWAMTLDGKIASRTGDSRWISNAASRRRVHQLRGRVDAVIVGAGTALADDPRLTARPPGPRTATRIVVDRDAHLPIDSQLARTAREVPVRLFCGPNVARERVAQLADIGIEVIVCESCEKVAMAREVLEHCGRAEMTNVLVEGGGALLGALHDAELINEVHAFIAPKLIGGRDAITPVAGRGLASIKDSGSWFTQRTEQFEDNFLIVARKRAVAE
jgi:diaminohydroxyphosphoribosylaminopyrimidine deaminase/5-amino-6-(5-phosphoribosylamino)uracil reductase